MNHYKGIAYGALDFRRYLHREVGIPDRLPKKKPRYVNIVRAIAKTHKVRI